MAAHGEGIGERVQFRRGHAQQCPLVPPFLHGRRDLADHLFAMLRLDAEVRGLGQQGGKG